MKLTYITEPMTLPDAILSDSKEQSWTDGSREQPSRWEVMLSVLCGPGFLSVVVLYAFVIAYYPPLFDLFVFPGSLVANSVRWGLSGCSYTFQRTEVYAIINVVLTR
jgi:hypothetical protein